MKKVQESIDALITRLRAAARGAGQEVVFSRPLTKKKLAALETALGLRLPPSYAHLLTAHGTFRLLEGTAVRVPMEAPGDLRLVAPSADDAVGGDTPAVEAALGEALFFQRLSDDAVEDFACFNPRDVRADGELGVVEYRHDERFTLPRLLGTKHARRFRDFEAHLTGLVTELEAQVTPEPTKQRARGKAAAPSLAPLATVEASVYLLADGVAAARWDGQADRGRLELATDGPGYRKASLARIETPRGQGWLFHPLGDRGNADLFRLSEDTLLLMKPSLSYWQGRGDARALALARALVEAPTPKLRKWEGTVHLDSGVLLVADCWRAYPAARRASVPQGASVQLEASPSSQRGVLVGVPAGEWSFARRSVPLKDVTVGLMVLRLTKPRG